MADDPFLYSVQDSHKFVDTFQIKDGFGVGEGAGLLADGTVCDVAIFHCELCGADESDSKSIAIALTLEQAGALRVLLSSVLD